MRTRRSGSWAWSTRRAARRRTPAARPSPPPATWCATASPCRATCCATTRAGRPWPPPTRPGWPRACRSSNACCAPWRLPRREGGDVRGRQSAAIMVVDARAPARRPGAGGCMDMRIEDHPDPVPELRRIVTLQLAYDLLNDEGDAAKAGMSAEERYAEARRMAPDAYELVFWRALELATRRGRGRRAPRDGDRGRGRRRAGAARSSTWRRRAARASRPSWRRSCWATERARDRCGDRDGNALTRPMRTTARIGVSARLGTRHVSQATRQKPHGCPAAPLYATRAYRRSGCAVSA